MQLRDAATDPRTRARAVLLAGIVGGLLTLAFFALFRPNPDTTFDVFYYAAAQSMDGRIDYETGHGLWVYSPPALFYFYPYAVLFDFETARNVHRVVSVLVTVGYAGLLVRFVGRHVELETIDRLCIGGFAILSVYPVVNVVNGSFVGVFTALLGTGWILMESDRGDVGGAAWALASIVKAYAVFWGIYMLRVREWRGVAGAFAAGIGATVVGGLVFGFDAYFRYVEETSEGRVRYHLFRNGASPDNEAVTPLRALGQLFPNVDPSFWTPVLLVAVGVLTLVVFYLVPAETVLDRATLLLATILGVWFVMPTSQDLDAYIVYAPLLFLLFAERESVVQGAYVLGTLALSYNVGRGELRAVSEAAGLADPVMAIGEPVLSFATMPMWGLSALYVGVLVKATVRGRETGRVADAQRKLRSVRRRDASG